MASADPREEAGRVLDIARTREPTLGPGRLVCVDGPAGSGKSTLARALVQAAPGAILLETDEMLQGWGGLSGLETTLDAVLRPLASGRASSWRRWDWHADAWAKRHPLSPVAPDGLVVVEGVGSGAGAVADLCTVLVWVEAPDDVRLERGIRRDGEAMREHWLAWMEEETALHAAHRTRERADVVVRTA